MGSGRLRSGSESRAAESAGKLTVADLLRWQWRGYPGNRQSPANLIIHIVVVLFFLAGYVGSFVALVDHATVIGIVSLVAMVVSLALRDLDHRREENSPQPFTGLVNAVSRILLEPWITLPRFVCSGKRRLVLHRIAPL